MERFLPMVVFDSMIPTDDTTYTSSILDIIKDALAPQSESFLLCTFSSQSCANTVNSLMEMKFNKVVDRRES